jgi:hypothetical protein
VHGDDRADAGKLRITVVIPYGARQSLGVQMRVGMENSSWGNAAAALF